MNKQKRINILEHELVPEHRVLSLEEAKEVLRRLGCASPADLPWISINDPVVKAIKAKPGDIIMVTRKSPTAGVSVSFRYVVINVEGGEGSEESEEEASGEEE